MGHEIVELPELHLAGMSIDCLGFDTSGIGPLWDRFFQNWDVARALPGVLNVWGASLPAADGFRYMAALRVAQPLDSLPEGFHNETLRAAKYVKLPFNGTPPEMSQEFQRIFHEVLPSLGYSIQPGFCCLEEYPQEGAWDEATGKLKADLYVELK